MKINESLRERTASRLEKMMRVYPDTSFVIRLVKTEERGSEVAQEVWNQFRAGHIEMLFPVLTEKELNARTMSRFLQIPGVENLLRAPGKTQFPPILCGVPNPATGRVLVAGARAHDTRRVYRAGDSFTNPALTALCRILSFGNKKQLDNERHVSDEEDVRHLIQAAEWQCDVFLTCEEEKGKIWKHRSEIEKVIGTFFKTPLRILQPDGLMRFLTEKGSYHAGE